MIDNNLKSIIDNQIKDYLLLKDPSEQNITPQNNLIKINNGQIDIISNENPQDKHRLFTFIKILKKINISNVKCSFLLNTLDVTPDNNIKTLCFSKKKHQAFITIPNVHILLNVVNMFLDNTKKYDMLYDKKINKSIFCGCPTGQHSKNDFGKRVKYISETMHNNIRQNHLCILVNDSRFIEIDYQLKFKYLINIDGNSCSWDRIYWQISSNSLTWYYERDEYIVELYHELLKDNIHYVPISNNLIEVYNFFEHDNSSIDYRQSIINNGKEFTKKYFETPQNDYERVIEYILNSISDKK